MYRTSINVMTTKWGRKLCTLLMLFVFAFAGLVQPASAATTDTRVLPQLQNEAAAKPSTQFRVIVTRIQKNTAADSAVTSLGGRKIKNLTVDAFVATLPGGKIAALGKSAAVKFVNYDAPMLKLNTVDSSKLGNLYPLAANATGLWSSSGTGAAVTGAGIGVAVLDSGITATRPDFVGRVPVQVSFNSASKSMADSHGHGTHVAGIIAGNNSSSGSLTAGKYIGIAPGAKLINVKVSDDLGVSYVSDVVNAIEWVIANRQTHNIRVMNLSLISSVAESYKTSVLSAAVERAWFSGILVVVAAGNAGPNTMQYPPANDPFVITVGAADPMGTAAQSNDTIAPWSSYGTTQDGFSKPEVVAPGRYMVSVLSSGNATLATQDPTRVVDNNYIRLSGTSMAAPVVAGIAALAFQKHPEWTNDQVKWLLQNTTQSLGTTTTTTTDPTTGAVTTTSTFTPLPGQGSGEVNAAAVVNYSGTPSVANQGLTPNEQLIGPNGATTYTSGAQASWSTASWSTASWSTASWSTASWSTASWSTANWSTASWSSVTEKTVK